MSSSGPLTRIGAVAALVGAPLFFIATLLHPLGSDPNDPVAAFTEYAADNLWVATHLGQFIGVVAIAVGLIARVWISLGATCTG